MMKLDLKEIEKWIRIVEQSRISELEIIYGRKKIRIVKGQGLIIESKTPDSKILEAEPGKAIMHKEPELREILSLTVGTFYQAEHPEKEPLTKEGGQVEIGQTLGVIEAMSQHTVVQSDFKGTVKEILVENGQPVEYGQPLFKIEISI